MDSTEFDAALDLVLEADSRYSRSAYQFVREVLERSQIRQQRKTSRKSTQVGVVELLQRIRIEALDQFGPMTCAVFEEWGIRSCEDFGEIVFNLMDRRIVERGRRDRREDFRHGFDFTEAFCQPFEPIRRSRVSLVAIR